MLKQENRTYPFEHIVIDEFFTQKLFDELIKEIKKMDLSFDDINGDFRCISRINKEGQEEFADGLSTKLLTKIFKDKNEFLLEKLRELAPKKHSLYEFTELRIQKAQEAYSSGAHTDSAQKLLSVVIYLHPEEEEGTQMYERKDGEIVAQCEWQQNRAFVFARKENRTWHSWASKGNKGRFVLVYTLMTSQPKAALKSEGLLSRLFAFKKNVLSFVGAY